jgi:hypothetical protein
MRMRHTVICGPAGSTTFLPHYVTNGDDFLGGGGGELTEHKMCVLIFSTTFVWRIRILSTDFRKKILKISKFHKYQSSVSPVVPFRRTNGQQLVTNHFANLRNVLKMHYLGNVLIQKHTFCVITNLLRSKKHESHQHLPALPVAKLIRPAAQVTGSDTGQG